MKTICVVTQDPALAGGELAKLELFLRWAASRGHRCVVVYPAEGNGEAGERRARAIAGLYRTGALDRVVAVPIAGWTPHWTRAASFARRSRIDRESVAYQLVAGSLDLGLPLLRAATPFVAWVAGSYTAEVCARPRTRLRHYGLYNPLFDALTRRQEARVGRAARRVLAVSAPAARRLADELCIDPDRVGVLAPGVDTERFRPAGRDGAAPDPPYVFSAARLDRGKGFPTLLRAFRLVANEHPGVQLRIAGDGPELAALRSLAAAFGLTGRIRFDGHLEGQELVAAYQGAVAFALASRYEALGIVVLEAMACGLPVVCTDCGGVRDSVEPGRTGYLVPVGDERVLAARFLEVLGDSALASAMGRAGRGRVVRQFADDRVARRLDEIYAEATERVVA